MNKQVNALKTIGEVSKELKIHTHIIRFWESKFDKLKSVKEKITIGIILKMIFFSLSILIN